MNAIKNSKLTMVPRAMAMGAALVAASMSTTPAQANDFDEFTRQARSKVLAEATSQPGPEARVQVLRGALENARVVRTDSPLAGQREQALAAIRAEQMADFQARSPVQIARSMEDARIVKRMPNPDRRIDEAVATVRAEQLEAMRRQAASQIAASLAHARVVDNIALAGIGTDTGSSD